MKKNRVSRFVIVCVAALALVLQYSLPAMPAYGASFTITYKDANGSVISTTEAASGSTITLRNYPAGAIAWVDTGSSALATAKSVSANAKGMGYVNYSSSDPNNSSPVASSMKFTMPSSDVTLTAFYGNYQNGNEPRLVQYHLALSYHDVNSGMDLQYDDAYRNINAPAGYVIALADENYFDPIKLRETNSSTGAVTNVTSGLKVDKWVDDESYTGSTSVAANLIHNPSSLVYVDPNDYRQIYNVMVDQSLDYITGGKIQPPSITNPTVPPLTPPVATTDTVKIRFNIDTKICNADGNQTGDNAPNDAGFRYDMGGQVNDSGTVNISSANPYLEFEIPKGTYTFQEYFGLKPGAATINVPIHNIVPLYGYFYWTQEGYTDASGKPVHVDNTRMAPGDTINADYTFTLHYVRDVTVRFNFDTQAFDSDGTSRLPLPNSGAEVGFTFNNKQNSGTVMYTDSSNYIEYSIPYGTTWEDFFGLKPGATTINVPIHKTVTGYERFYWTADAGVLPYPPSSIIPDAGVTSDHVFTLHYVKDPEPTSKLIIKLNTAAYTYDGSEHRAAGYTVLELAGRDYSIPAEATGNTIKLPDGNYLKFTGRSLGFARGTEVGSYPFDLSPGEFSVYTADPGLGPLDPNANVTSQYTISVLAGGLTISPVFTTDEDNDDEDDDDEDDDDEDDDDDNNDDNSDDEDDDSNDDDSNDDDDENYDDGNDDADDTEDTDDTAGGDETSSDSGENTSPRTGDIMYPIVFIMVLLVSAIGQIVVMRKRLRLRTSSNSSTIED